MSDVTTPGAKQTTANVTVANFVRAETDHMIRANMEMVGVDFGQFAHLREPTTPDNQPVIRMNQDALYSSVLLDLSQPAEITLPEVGTRFAGVAIRTFYNAGDPDDLAKAHAAQDTIPLTGGADGPIDAPGWPAMSRPTGCLRRR